MREFKDSITGKDKADEDDDDDARRRSAAQADAALGRPEGERPPLEGEVVLRAALRSAPADAMATALRPIGHEDRLSLVEHLDELRTRLIICIVAFLVAFGVCLWQNTAILNIINRPLEQRDAFTKNSARTRSSRRAAYQRR